MDGGGDQCTSAGPATSDIALLRHGRVYVSDSTRQEIVSVGGCAYSRALIGYFLTYGSHMHGALFAVLVRLNASGGSSSPNRLYYISPVAFCCRHTAAVAHVARLLSSSSSGLLTPNHLRGAIFFPMKLLSDPLSFPSTHEPGLPIRSRSGDASGSGGQRRRQQRATAPRVTSGSGGGSVKVIRSPAGRCAIRFLDSIALSRQGIAFHLMGR